MSELIFNNTTMKNPNVNNLSLDELMIRSYPIINEIIELRG